VHDEHVGEAWKAEDRVLQYNRIWGDCFGESAFAYASHDLVWGQSGGLLRGRVNQTMCSLQADDIVPTRPMGPKATLSQTVMTGQRLKMEATSDRGELVLVLGRDDEVC
jgi:hypothetical protein